MKKIFLSFVLLVALISLTSAEVTQVNNFKYREIDSNQNKIDFNTPINNVNIIGFICVDSSCSSTSGNLWNGNVLTSQGSSITLTYPTSIPQGNYGYGIYMYKDGYRTFEVLADWHGNGQATTKTRYLAKQQTCTSEINSFDVSVLNQNVNINVNIDSALEHMGPLDYVPNQLLTKFYSTKVDINLEIKDSSGKIIHTETKQKTIEYSNNEEVSFSKNLNHGDYIVKVYTTLGNEEKCLSYSKDSKEKNINIAEPDTNPTIDTISANPDSGFIPLEVQFNCIGTGGNGKLSYFWNFGDGETSNNQNPKHTYTTKGDFTAVCTVTDTDGDTDSKSVNINAGKNPLEITDLTCFENVIENNNQSCSIYVEDFFNSPVGDAEVKVYYLDGSFFGTCNTDSISGGCIVKDLQEAIGDFTVYATAEKNNFKNDDDKNPKFSYTVLEEKYEITDLKVYNDKDFTIEDYDFFRGEELYVKFKVLKNGILIEDMITQATLVSLPGGRVDLSEIENYNGEYFYKLEEIPLTHDFLGDSNIFTFAFNFTDNSGGQSEVNLIIRNNLPMIDPKIQDEEVYVGKEITINLSEHEFDKEDSGENLTWEIIGEGEKFNATIEGKILTIKGIKKGTDNLVLRLYDLDNDFDYEEFEVRVKKKSNGGGGGGSGGNNIIGHKEVIEPKTNSFSGTGFFIQEEPEEEIPEDTKFMKFVKSGWLLLIIFFLLLIVLLILILVLSRK